MKKLRKIDKNNKVLLILDSQGYLPNSINSAL